MQQLAEWQVKLLANYKTIKKVLDTDEGQKFLTVLDEQFASYNLFAATDRETSFNLGQRSLVDYLKTMADTPAEVLEKLQPKVTRGA